MRFDFSVNESATISYLPIEGSSHIVVIIDDFLQHPEEVLKYAKNHAYLTETGGGGGNTYYPGIRDHMPDPFKRSTYAALQPLVSKKYYQGREIQEITPQSYLQLTTTPPENLTLQQKMPHVDSTHDHEFATVLYLCSEQHGGTSLYRYKPTGDIQITRDKVHVMEHMIASVKEQTGEHSGYLTGDTQLFERVAKVEAKYNRLVMYKSNLLHSADIETPVSYQKNLDNGRLTVASFFFFPPISET